MQRRNRNILIVLTAVVIVLAVFSSFGLALFAPDTAKIVLPSTAAAVQTVEPDGGNARVDVTPQTVQNVVAVLRRLDSYARTVTTTLNAVTTTAQVWVDGGWTRTDLTLPSGMAAHTIVGDGTVWRWYQGAAASWPADERSADVDGQHIPTYEDVLALDPADITAAGYEARNGMDCVYIEAWVAELSQTERYWVSADDGLLEAAETEVDGEIVWSMTASVPEIPAPVTASFVLPDGTVLHTVGA